LTLVIEILEPGALTPPIALLPMERCVGRGGRLPRKRYSDLDVAGGPNRFDAFAVEKLKTNGRPLA